MDRGRVASSQERELPLDRGEALAPGRFSGADNALGVIAGLDQEPTLEAHLPGLLRRLSDAGMGRPVCVDPCLRGVPRIDRREGGQIRRRNQGKFGAAVVRGRRVSVASTWFIDWFLTGFSTKYYVARSGWVSRRSGWVFAPLWLGNWAVTRSLWLGIELVTQHLRLGTVILL